MTSLETKSSRDLFKSSSEGGNSQLRNRRDKEQMVTDYSNVTDSLMDRLKSGFWSGVSRD